MITSRYINAVEAAIDYIENNLDSVTNERVASVVGFSPYHFHRVFTALIGESVTQYVRKRKLSRAAETLLTSERGILDIALEAGFESQEAFGRAFKRMYGVTPGLHRQRRSNLAKKERLTLDMVLYMNNTIRLQPKIVERPMELAIGMGASFKEGDFDKIHALWTDFLQRKHEIKDARKGFALGICGPTIAGIEKAPDDTFVYMAALPVRDTGSVPEGMVLCEIPSGRYAAFTHRGKLSDLPQTVKFIWGTWLPQSEYEYIETQPDFELYDDRFDSASETGEIDIYVPIR